MFLLFCFTQNLLCGTTPLSTLATSVNKSRPKIFHKKHPLPKNRKDPMTVLRIKNGKGIDARDNLHYQVPGNTPQHDSNEGKHEAEDTVDPAELNLSEASPVPTNKSSPSGTLAELNSNFENEPDPEIEKSNQDCCKNNKQEPKNEEENELGKNETGQGRTAEDVRHGIHVDPGGPAAGERDRAEAAAEAGQCAEDDAAGRRPRPRPGGPRDPAQADPETPPRRTPRPGCASGQDGTGPGLSPTRPLSPR